MSSNSHPTQNPAINFARQTSHAGIPMILIGHFQDLAAYYAGNDGNAWCYHTCGRSWSNEGRLLSFLDTFSTRRRGQLLQPLPLETAGQVRERQEQAANARLSAHAPAMLKALEEAKYLLAVAADHGFTKHCPELEQTRHVIRETLALIKTDLPAES